VKSFSSLEQSANQLAKNLEEQYKAYGECIELASTQRRALVNHRYEDCTAVNVLQERKAQSLEELEVNRQQILTQIETELHHNKLIVTKTPRTTLKVEHVVPYVSQELAHILNEVTSKLRMRLNELKLLHNTNSQIIEESRKISKKTIEILTHLAMPVRKQETPTYSVHGKIREEKPSVSNLIHIQA
jgi:anion-transporting  ArsA/GET3 family ATPase